MDSFHPLKKAFWDDVGFGILTTVFILGILLLGGLGLSVLWWIVTHGLKGLLLVLVIVAAFYALNLIGKGAQKI